VRGGACANGGPEGSSGAARAESVRASEEQKLAHARRDGWAACGGAGAERGGVRDAYGEGREELADGSSGGRGVYSTLLTLRSGCCTRML